MDSSQPLLGIRVAVTRPRDRASELIDRLHELGAEVRNYPLIRLSPPADSGPLRQAAAALSRYHWVVFTSPSAVSALVEAGVDPAPLQRGSLHIAAVGPATSAAVERAGGSVHALPDSPLGEAIVTAMLADGPLVGQAVLWPRAAAANPALREALLAAGAVVDEVEAYRTDPDDVAAKALAEEVGSGMIDVLTFTAPSAVAAFMGAAPALPRGLRVVAIGRATGQAVRTRGMTLDAEAEMASVEGLVDAVLHACRDNIRT